MKDFGLYVILTDPVVSHEKIAESCVRHGVSMIQLREKNMDDRELLEKAQNISDIVKGSKTRFIMNDRADIALLCNAQGIHVGQDDLPVSSVRSLCKKEDIVGLSTHSLEQAKKGLLEHPDYIGFGPIYPTFAKKKPDPAVGAEAISKVLAIADVPVVCIGGINRDNIDEVLGAGARNIAMISGVCKKENYDEEIRFYRDKLRIYDTNQ